MSWGIRPNEYIYSTVINGLSRAGDPDGALGVWEMMIGKGTRPNTVLYTALIDGLCRHGRVDEAEDALSKMIAEDCTPNVLTYSSLVFVDILRPVKAN